MRDLALNSMIYFEAVARCSLIARAADELTVSPSAVSQQIKLLEERFGVRLFRRVKRRLVLTEEGERLFEATTQAFALINDARNTLTRKTEMGKLTLRVSPTFGVRWLSPRLSAYSTINPEPDIHIDATTDLTDFELETIDLDIRYGHGDWPGLHSENIVKDCVMPMCSPSYAATLRESGSSVTEQLAKARFITTVKAYWSWEKWFSSHGLQSCGASGRLLFDRSSMSLQLAKDGAGVVLESATLAMNELKTRQLIPLFPELGVIRFDAYWLICPQRHLYRPQVKRFREWILDAAAEHELDKTQLLVELGCS